MTHNPHLSLHAAWLLVVAIFACAIAPPIGIFLIVLAFFTQKRFRRLVRAEREYRLAKARARLRREKILAARSLR